MMEDKQKTLYGFQLLADAVCIIIAYIFAYYLRFYIPLFSVKQMMFLALGEYLKLLIYLVPMYLLIYMILRIFVPLRKNNKSLELIRLLLTNVLGLICFFAVLFLMKEYNISRIFLLIFSAVNIVLGIGVRWLFFVFVYKNKDEEKNETIR